MLFLLISLLLLNLGHCQNSISITNRSINAVTSYQVKITFNFTSLSSTGKLVISFPSAGYSASQISSASCPTYTCQASGLTLSINNTLIPNAQNISIVINNLVNPGNTLSRVAQSLTITFNTASGNQTTSIALGTFTAGTLQSCSISFSTSVVNTHSTATITIGNLNPVSNGSVQITFPQYWVGSASTSSVTLVSGTINCGSHTCTYTESFYNVLTISNITAAASSSISVSVSTILSPPTSLANTELKAATASSDENSIDSSVSCTIPALSPKTVSISTNISSVVVNTNFSPLFSFTSSDPIKAGDTIHLTLSSFLATVTTSPLSFASSAITSSLTLIASTLYQYNISSSNSSSIIPTSSFINMSGLTFKSGKYATDVSNSFTFTLLRNGYSYQTGTVSLMFTPNTISTISITSQINVVQVSTTANILFTTLTSLSSSSIIIVTIPNSIPIFNCGDSLQINSTTSTFTCQKGSSGRTLIMSSFTSTTVNPSTFNIKLNMTNPFTTESSVFGVTTVYDSSTYNESSGSGITDKGTVSYTPTASSPSCSVTSSSTVIGAISSYSLRCVASSMLLAGSQIIVTIPSEITTVSPTVQVQINGTTFSNQYSVTNQIVSITNYLTQNISSGSTVTIIISSLMNPQNFSTTSSFIASFSYNTYLIEYASTNINTAMNQPSVFYSLNIQPQSQMNGQSTSYNFTLNTSVIIKSGYLLTVQIPSSVLIVDPQCDSSLSCSATSNILSITLNNNYNYNSIITIVVSGFTNPRTYSPSGQFKFNMYNSGTLYQSGTFSGFSNSLPNYIQSLTKTLISPGQEFLNSTQTLKFNVITKNTVNLASGEYFVLAVPSSFTGAGLSCLTPYSCSFSGNTVRVSSTSTTLDTNFTFTIVNLKTSPSLTDMQAGTVFFSISSFTLSNTAIDVSNSSTKVQFILSCDPSCQTCQTGNPSLCTSCYSNASLIGDQCTICVDGQFKDLSTGECVNCSSSCKTCNMSATNCTSCKDDMYFVQDKSTCVTAENCPSQTVPLNNVCQQCSITCNECSNSTTQCVSCAPSYTKRNINSSECVTECDNGLVKYNGLCQCFQCLTCSGVYTNCTSCDPSSANKYLFNNTCITQCPRGTYVLGSMCLPCPDGCQSCTATQCLDQLQRSLSNKIIPIPFTLGTLVVGVLAVLSKIICSATFMPSFIISVGSILQIISWVVLLAIIKFYETSSFKIIGTILIAAGLAINYLLNFANLFLIWRYLLGDKAFSFWFRKQSSKINSRISLVISGVLNHRYIHLLFSKAFNSQSLSATLQFPYNIVPVYIVTGLGFIAEILVIAGCANIAYDPHTYSSSQLFIECIDIIILNVLMIIFTSWNFIKPDGFFKPFQINKYQDADTFKNNQTIEDLHDKYLENLEIEEVTGGFGGKPKYINTRLHLEGLDEKALQKNKHTVKSNIMSKSVGDESNPGNILAHKLITKVMQRIELDGISQNNQDSKSSNSRQPLSPEKEHERPKVNAIMTDFEQKNEKKMEASEIGDDISISNDSLVRYEIPVEVEEVDVIFAPQKGRIMMDEKGIRNKQISENQENSLTQKINTNYNASKNIANKMKRKRNRKNKNRDNNEINLNINIDGQQEKNSNIQEDQISQGQCSNNSYESLHQDNSRGQSFIIPDDYDQDQVPAIPAYNTQSYQHQNSTNLDNIPNSTDYNWQKQEGYSNPIRTLYHSKAINNYQSQKGLKNKKSLNQTANEFRKKKFISNELEEDQEQFNVPTTTQYNVHPHSRSVQRPQLKQQFYNSNPNLPYHKFERYLDDDSSSIFDSQNNQLSEKKQTNESSMGSIKKNKVTLRDQDITRQVVSKHILAPETPIKIPSIPAGSHLTSVTEPLSTIVERPLIGNIKVQNPALSQKLKSVEKIYLQKLKISDSSTSSKR